jgi:hypothetical protein
MSGFLGKDGFAWFFGVVEDRKDPLKIGRVKVRILGYHDDDKNVLPTTKLPWATPIQGVTSAAVSGKGWTPLGLVEGTWVFGFFADPGSYQIPMILGSIAGLNSKSINTLGEYFGNAFADLRTESERSKAPNDRFEKREYPNGKGKDGDKHGAQLETSSKNSSYPKSNYSPTATNNPDGTPDTNILGINDNDRLDQTSVGVKNSDRNSGGTRDTAVPVADVNFEPFETGIINNSGANKGTNKSLATGYNGLKSSSKPSLKQNYKQFKDQPTNANGKTVYSSGAGGVGVDNFLPVSISAAAGCYKSNMDNIKNGTQQIKKDVEQKASTALSTTASGGRQTTSTAFANRSRDFGSYVPTTTGSSTSPNDVQNANNNKLGEQKQTTTTPVEQVGSNDLSGGFGNQTSINGMAITRDNFGNILLNGVRVPIVDATKKITNQSDADNPDRDKECGNCGCDEPNK